MDQVEHKRRFFWILLEIFCVVICRELKGRMKETSNIKKKCEGGKLFEVSARLNDPGSFTPPLLQLPTLDPLEKLF